MRKRIRIRTKYRFSYKRRSIRTFVSTSAPRTQNGSPATGVRFIRSDGTRRLRAAARSTTATKIAGTDQRAGRGRRRSVRGKLMAARREINAATYFGRTATRPVPKIRNRYDSVHTLTGPRTVRRLSGSRRTMGRTTAFFVLRAREIRRQIITGTNFTRDLVVVVYCVRTLTATFRRLSRERAFSPRRGVRIIIKRFARKDSLSALLYVSSSNDPKRREKITAAGVHTHTHTTRITIIS